MAIICFDQPSAGMLREKARPAHLAYLKQHASPMRIGGPIENDEGGIVGPLFIIDVDNRAAALTLTQHEPFHMAGIFEAVLRRRWRQMQPVLVAGANFISATEANLQLCEEGIHDR